jgi:general secretion pathway protein D
MHLTFDVCAPRRGDTPASALSRRPAILFAIVLALATGCATPTAHKPSSGHVMADGAEAAAAPRIPKPVLQSPTLPPPRPAPKAETYSVVVNNVRVQDLLFALARDAKVNVDIHPGISGTVTLNAIDQTLPQILSRVAKQVDMRFELDGPNLVVMPDAPFLRTYKVDYVNMSRDVSGAVAINTQITSASTGPAGAGTGGSVGGSNSSTTEVKNTARNRFWESLEKNIKDILRETDKILPEGSSETTVERADSQSTTGTGVPPPPPGARGSAAAPSIAASPNPAVIQNSGTTVVKRTTFREAASVIMNPETGVVVVRATSRQHEKVQEFLDQVAASAKRQVLIETTIVEVSLNDNHQQGINWSALPLGGKGFSLSQAPSAGGIPSGAAQSLLVLSYNNPTSRIGNLAATISLLDAFGTVKVLSSPKLSVLNNQTALLKVVDNIVYFHVQANTTTPATGPSQTTVTTTPHSVSVGLVMSVTPQISDADTVLLNVRPTISRVTGVKRDPNPNIPATIPNEVPEIQTREMESVLRVQNGDIAVMGGLMEDRINYRDDAVPGLSRLPGIGTFFTHRNDTNTKTELVIFLRPVIVRDASLGGDYRSLREQLPGKDFFDHNRGPQRQELTFGGDK